MSIPALPLLATTDGAVRTLTLNRPERLNSLTFDLLDALTAGLHEAEADPAVRCVVIRGAGRGFSAGADISAQFESGRAPDIRAALREHYVPAIRAITGIDTPVLAAINGVAAGAGLSLALACDLRVAAESATLIQAFVRIGLVPDAGASWFLPRLVGTGRAAELALLGDPLSAADAERIGLVNRCVPDAEFDAAVAGWAFRLAAGPRSVGLIKRQLRGALEPGLDAQLELEAELQAEAALSDDFREGVAAFFEKRPPEFRGS